MKKLIFGLLAIALLAVAAITLQSSAPTSPPPGFSNLWSQAFNLDTLTNTETGTYEFNRQFDYPSTMTWQVNDIELSGTATNLVTVQQTTCATCTDWITTDTVASITATGNHFIHLTHDPNIAPENLLWGYRTRLRCVNSGTGVHSVRIFALGRTDR